MGQITLPKKNIRLVGQLQQKLQEYKARLKEVKKNMVGKQLSRWPDMIVAKNTEYKIAVLGELLRDGKVVFYEVEKRLRQKQKNHFSYPDLDDAFEVIRCYCTGREREVHGGTGLPKLKD